MRYLSLILLLFTGWSTYAQNSEVNKADRYRETSQLSDAKVAIDRAIENDKTKEKARTWYVYGQVYQDIYLSEDKTVQDLDANAFQKAVEGYQKTIDYSNTNTTYKSLANFNLDNLWSDCINRGAMAYQSRENKQAIYWFDNAKVVRPKDTTAYLYAGLAAIEIQDDKLALNNFKQLIDLNYHSLDIYNSVIYYLKVGGNNLEALKYCQKAREQYPENTELQKQEINLYIQTDQIEKARNELSKAIEKEPNNSNLLFNMGYLSEEVGEKENALKYYKKALEVDPKSFDATYNLGVYYYNKAAALFKAANELPLGEFKTKGEPMEAEANELLKKALPYMEKASSLRPNEPIIWNTLSTIYTRLEIYDKADEAYKKYNELRGGN